MNEIKGGCLCGTVRFAFAEPVLWLAHCHCASCRRNTGAAVATFVGVARDCYRLISGTPAVYASSPGVHRSFCGRCGTPLTYEAERWPGEVHINIGAVDEPGRFPPTLNAKVWVNTTVDRYAQFDCTAVCERLTWRLPMK